MKITKAYRLRTPTKGARFTGSDGFNVDFEDVTDFSFNTQSQSWTVKLRSGRTQSVDVLYAHWPDPEADAHAWLEAFGRLVGAGKVRYVAASNFVDFAGLGDLLSPLLELTARGMRREDAYRVVQGHAMEAWRTEGDFRQRVSEDPEVRAVLKDSEIAEVFRLERYLQHVDALFARAFLGARAEKPSLAGVKG